MEKRDKEKKDKMRKEERRMRKRDTVCKREIKGKGETKKNWDSEREI